MHRVFFVLSFNTHVILEHMCHPELVSGSIYIQGSNASAIFEQFCHPELISGSYDQSKFANTFSDSL